MLECNKHFEMGREVTDLLAFIYLTVKLNKEDIEYS